MSSTFADQYGVKDEEQQDFCHTAFAGASLLEVLSVALSVIPTMALAVFNHTHEWMWVMWSVGAGFGALWSVRVKAWWFLLLNVVYLAINIIGLARLLGISFS